MFVNSFEDIVCQLKGLGQTYTFLTLQRMLFKRAVDENYTALIPVIEMAIENKRYTKMAQIYKAFWKHEQRLLGCHGDHISKYGDEVVPNIGQV